MFIECRVLGCSYFTYYSLKHLKEQDAKQMKSRQFLVRELLLMHDIQCTIFSRDPAALEMLPPTSSTPSLLTLWLLFCDVLVMQDVSLSNLLPFNSLSPVPEIHTWPTSLSFRELLYRLVIYCCWLCLTCFVDLTVLSESSIHRCECYGLQKSVRLHTFCKSIKFYADLAVDFIWAGPLSWSTVCSAWKVL